MVKSITCRPCCFGQGSGMTIIMTIKFHLQWAKGDKVSQKAFKSKEAYGLLAEYCERVSKFVPCGISGEISAGSRAKQKTNLWICDRTNGARVFSSEEIAQALKKICDGGERELQIVIGGPDGFSKEALDNFSPDLRWSFGSLTLPHELAAVVASEQIYRAWTILRGLPYHAGH